MKNLMDSINAEKKRRLLPDQVRFLRRVLRLITSLNQREKLSLLKNLVCSQDKLQFGFKIEELDTKQERKPTTCNGIHQSLRSFLSPPTPLSLHPHLPIHRRKPTTTPPPFFPSLNISLAAATAPTADNGPSSKNPSASPPCTCNSSTTTKSSFSTVRISGPSNLTLPDGKCRYNDEVLHQDCTAHSLLYDVASNTFRPLMVQTDVWCSSGAVNSDGTLVQTGGYHDGDHKIRLFTPCLDELCDWIELQQNLTVQRWYSSDHILPDGRIIVVGGRRAFSYEFFPTVLNQKSIFYFPFLKETTDPKEENNLYPFLHLLPDGNLFVFANQRSVVLDYVNNKIVKEFPTIPGEKRTYPATGSSVLLPLRLNPAAAPEAEVMK
ncbi:hypothetical protein RD792_015286 [Penstemon davidsonii]|uniref:Glyoxal oxidase N-terminal domain-containing protein n=1 Tax=Penstemon davidsonii TaxID=160366 RepID=A0ABR0CTU3_9LAMI|nr:hypothetical protein RD792_015286 [Penstemon davidsonii]